MSRFWLELKYNIKRRWNPINWIPASILCVRFPFLYPRNRFTGKHYNNWKLNDLQCECRRKAYDFIGEIGNKENPYRRIVKSRWQLFCMKFYEALENFIGIFHAIPYYTELDVMDTGWRKAFGIQMCKEIKRALLQDGGRKLLHRYRITPIKEKYGCLCWYDMGGTEETNKIIAKYEYISIRTCINCGRSADYVTLGWIEPYCKNCLPKGYDTNDPEQVSKYYTEENSWYGHYRIFPKNNEEEQETYDDEGKI